MIQMIRGGALALLAAASALITPVSCRPQTPEGSSERSTSYIAVFDRAWTVVDKYFYHPGFNGVDWATARSLYRPRAGAARTQAELYGVLAQMTAELKDSHTRVMAPAQAKRFKQGEFLTWGFRLVPHASEPTVGYVFAESPADLAGVEPGWKVSSVDGAPFDPFTPLEGGRRATLRFTDGQGVERRLALAPHKQELGALRFERRGEVVVVSLPGVTLGMTKNFQKRTEGLDRSKPMIIDVRGTPGGYAEELARLMGCFLPQDAVLASSRTRNREWKETRVRGCKCRWTGPVAVLIDGGTASAAEVLAASIKVHHRGVLVGARTAGAATGGDFADLPDGGGMVVARFDTRDAGGSRLEGVGVEPDIAAVTSGADRRAGRDPARDKAVEVLTAARTPG